jgi:hypothetical protein
MQVSYPKSVIDDTSACFLHDPSSSVLGNAKRIPHICTLVDYRDVRQCDKSYGRVVTKSKEVQRRTIPCAKCYRSLLEASVCERRSQVAPDSLLCKPAFNQKPIVFRFCLADRYVHGCWCHTLFKAAQATACHSNVVADLRALLVPLGLLR